MASGPALARLRLALRGVFGHKDDEEPGFFVA
jgi:hypothetical protein